MRIFLDQDTYRDHQTPQSEHHDRGKQSRRELSQTVASRATRHVSAGRAQQGLGTKPDQIRHQRESRVQPWHAWLRADSLQDHQPTHGCRQADEAGPPQGFCSMVQNFLLALRAANFLSEPAPVGPIPQGLFDGFGLAQTFST